MYWITLLSFLFFTLLVAIGTWLIVRGKEHDSEDGFFLAGRSLTFPFIAGSLLLTNLSTEQMVGLNGSAYTEGFVVMAWEVVAVVGLVAMAWFFLPKFLSAGVTTVPEYLTKRFSAGTGRIANVIFLVAYTFGLLPIILYTGATGLNGILDMKSLTGIQDESTLLWVMICFVGIIGSLYALFGGLRTVAVSDLLNGIGLLIGGFMILFFALAKAGAGAGIFAGLENVYTANPEKFNCIGSTDSSLPFSTLFTGVMVTNLFYWCTNQQIIQRTFGAKNLAEGQKGVLLCGALKLLGPLYLVLPGVIAFYFFSKENIKADLSYGMLVRYVLPAPLSGFFAAVMVGAILSSFNSVLNSTCTLFSLGVYKEWIRRGASEREVVASGRTFGWIVALFAMLTAPMLAKTTSIFTYLQYMNSIYATPILAVTIIALWTRKVPAFAAVTALIAGFVLMGIGVLCPISMNTFHYSGLVFAILILFMLSMGKLFPTEKQMRLSAPVDMKPWKFAWITGAVLIFLIICSYLLLADNGVR